MDKNDLLLEQWKMSIDLYKHEADLAMKKFNYFIAINGILISSFVYSWTFAAEKKEINFTPFGVSISFFGIMINFIWMLTQYRGRIYQAYRVNQADQAEINLKINDERVLDLFKTKLEEQTISERPNKYITIGTNKLILYLAGLLSYIWLILLMWAGSIFIWLYNVAYCLIIL